VTALDVQAVRVALAAAVQGLTVTLSGTAYQLTAEDFIGSQIACPYFHVAEWTENFDDAMARGLDTHTVLARLYAQPVANTRVGSALLAAYMRPDGATSVRAALSADRTLGGTCQTMRVTGTESFASYSVGTAQFIGIQYRMSIW